MLEKDGMITTVSWHDPYIAFKNEQGYMKSGMVDKIMRRLKEYEIKSKNSGSKSATLTAEDQLNLCRSLAHLYVYQGNDQNNEMTTRENAYNKAINLYLVIKDPTVFGVISKHNLFELVRDRVTELMDINQDLAIRLVLDNE
ncbi:vacuolar protein sorting-associated protein 41 like protein [Ditylenchus destructor]|nr:vacuolar protein sorting-associated protein 41 like protein [Ditylenchus destructor]